FILGLTAVAPSLTALQGGQVEKPKLAVQGTTNICSSAGRAFTPQERAQIVTKMLALPEVSVGADVWLSCPICGRSFFSDAASNDGLYAKPLSRRRRRSRLAPRSATAARGVVPHKLRAPSEYRTARLLQRLAVRVWADR